MNQEQVIRVGTWFKEKGVRGACASCGKKDWSLVGRISMPVTTALGVETGAVPTLQAQTVPAIATMCNECGYIMHFSSVMMGIR